MTWLLLRTSGFLVLGLLSVAVALGILGPALRSPRLRLVSITVHRTAAALGTLLLLAHVTAAVLDRYVEVSLPAVVIPGASAWQPLWIGLGALAFDAVLVLAVTSALRRRRPNLWWNVHVISYVAYALSWTHALGVGTDSGGPVMRWLAVASAALVGGAALLRSALPKGPVGVGLPRPVAR
jgi:predicted ferric reductase